MRNFCVVDVLAGVITGRRFPLLLLLISGISVQAQSWYNSSWNYRKAITINSSQVSGGSNLTNFPVLISLSSDSNLASTAQSNGNDILFTDSTGTNKLNHEIETYLSSTGQLIAWVQVPTLSASANTTIYMYYGNSSASNQQNPPGVWDSNFQGVWHFSNPAGLSGSDSTSNHNNASSITSTAAAGQIAGGIESNGSTQNITIPNSSTIEVDTGNLTVSLWFEQTAATSYAALLDKGTSESTRDLSLFLNGDSVAYHGIGDESGPLSGSTFTLNAWHYVVMERAGSSVTVYLDGSVYTTLTNGATTDSGANLVVGTNTSGGGTAFTGYVDELRLSNISRSAGWITTEYNSQSSPSTFFSVGSQQTDGGGGTVSITVTSAPTGLTVTVDGTNCTTPCSTFQWTPGSPHTLAAATQAGGTGTQYVFGSWTGNASSPDYVTAPSSATTYTATFTTQYYLTTSANPSSEGSISPASEWVNAGTVVSVSATADSGDQFTGFSGGTLSGTTTPQTVTMNGPVTVTANFNTSSSGPTVVQSTAFRGISPIALSFNSNVNTGDVIVVAVDADVDESTVSSITDSQGNVYTKIVQGIPVENVFSGEIWYAKNVTGGATTVTVTMSGSNAHIVLLTEIGGVDPTNPLDQSAINTNVAAPTWSSGSATTTSQTELIFGYQIQGSTTPGSGFTLIASGAWNLTYGAEYRVVSSAGSYDAEWANESQSGSGLAMMATFRAPQSGGGTVPITVTSVPTGLTVTVDGTNCATTPCTYQWTPGTSHTLAAATQAGGTGTQYVFGSWTGNASSPDQVTAPSTATTYTASFTTQYYLTTSAGSGGTISPASEWVNSGTSVPVTATANSGDQFTGFSGALSGTTDPQNLTVTAAATVTASFSAGSTSPYVTTYTYDAWNNLSQVTMTRPTGTQTRTFTYNGPYLMSATNPENGTVTYTYNSYNKVATKTDAKGQVIAYSYDSIARLIEVQKYPQGTSNAEDTCQRENYYYDTNNFETGNSNYSSYNSGRLTAVQYYGGSSTYAYSNPNCDTTFTENYGYDRAGGKIAKGLQVTRTLATGPPSNSSLWQYNPTTADLESTYTFDPEGRITAVQYPSSGPPGSQTAGPDLGYAMDTMGRLNTVTDLAAQASIISGATYGPANQLLTLSGQVNETRTYNAMLQLTNVTSSGYANSVNVTYNYSSTQNNGKITSQTDNISGEQALYTYDALNRLASATAASGSWGQSYGYDGFGNLTDQNVTAGSPPAYHVTINPSTNQRTIDCADANGNANAGSCASPLYTYDVKNRLVAVGTQQVQYSYAPGNKRVWRGVWSSGALATDEITFWSISGQKLATYQLSVTGGVVNNSSSTAVLVATQTATNYYFGRKLIKNVTGYVGTDRLGSIGHFYPYGQEKPSATTNGTEKFTGYFRDAETTLDYAKNRYHVPGTGRFLTADPYSGPSPYVNSPGIPGSWNKYAYVVGDPIRLVDPSGFCGSGYLGGGEPGSGGPSDPGTSVTSTINYNSDLCPVVPEDPGGGGGDNDSELALLSQALNEALDALALTGCGNLFMNKNGTAPIDPTTGNVLDPSQVLKSLVLAAEGEGDGQYGTISFANLGNAANVGQTTASGLNFWSPYTGYGPYYSTVSVVLNTVDWNLGYVTENATALLHELGHVMNDLESGFGSQNSFLPDGLSTANSQKNTAMVQDNCIKPLSQ